MTPEFNHLDIQPRDNMYQILSRVIVVTTLFNSLIQMLNSMLYLGAYH